MAKPLPDSPEFAPWLLESMTRAEFDAMPDSIVEALRPFATQHVYPQGTTIFRQGDRAGEMFLIERGQLELVYETRFERLVVQIVHPGAILDDLAAILDAPFRYSAVTLTETALLAIRLDTIRALEELFPEITLRWLHQIALSLERAYERLLELAGRSALEQVSHFLLHESAGREAHTVELTQGEVAATLALSRQTVSRVLRELAVERAVRRERRRIHILDREKLQQHTPR